MCQMPAWHVASEPQMLVAGVPVAWIFFIKFASVELMSSCVVKDQCVQGSWSINILTTNASLILATVNKMVNKAKI